MVVGLLGFAAAPFMTGFLATNGATSTIHLVLGVLLALAGFAAKAAAGRTATT